MITNVYLKSQPNKVIRYPDCYPDLLMKLETKQVVILAERDMIEAYYNIEQISRIEFKP